MLDIDRLRSLCVLYTQEARTKDEGRIEVLICGAGAAGLTLAIDLARRGVTFRLIDKLAGPFVGSRGKGIQPRTQEIFEDLGVLDRIVAVGGEYPPQRAYRDDGSYSESLVIEPVAPTPAEPYHIPLLVPQFLTERALRERLAELGHVVAFECELVGLERDLEGVTARLATPSGEEPVHARYLIGADGGRSFVRHTLGLDFPGETLGVRAVVADVTLNGVGPDAWHRWNEGAMESQLSLCPLPGADMFQLQAPVPLEGEIATTAQALTSMVWQRTGRRDIVIDTVPWSSVYAMNARLADRYRVGCVFLVGDAAHIHPPTGGQGLNTSVQDAYNLGWKLAAVLDGASDALLDSYEEERRPVAQLMLGLTTKLLGVAKAGSMRRGREVQQLDIGYPGSSLCFEQPERCAGALSGDRAPDASLVGAAGQAMRLFAVMKGPHWMAIGFETEGKNAPTPRKNLHVHHIGERGDVADREGHFAAAYGLAPGDWMLLRPDGYVGAIIASEHDQTLEKYLTNVGLRKIGRANI